MKGKVNYNQKSRFFKFIILWLITFIFMFSFSMIIYAIATNINTDDESQTNEASMQIEVIDKSKTNSANIDDKSETPEVKIEEDIEVSTETKISNDVSDVESSITEESSIQVEEENTSNEYIEEPEPEYISLGEFRLTAYCPCEICCEECAYNRPVDEYGNTIVYTASGKIAQEGYTIAADPDVLPYGTIVYIDGHEYEVQDCGGAITNNSIDIYFNTHEAACEFGLQYGEVFIKNV
jgi:3D (Asp-Asp-Asp) domain-containing protein